MFDIQEPAYLAGFRALVQELQQNLKEIIRTNEIEQNMPNTSTGLQYKETAISKDDVNRRKSELLKELVKARQNRRNTTTERKASSVSGISRVTGW
ncbi:hypothetical protein ACF0H5_000847 [Mactra antiquata]